VFVARDTQGGVGDANKNGALTVLKLWNHAIQNARFSVEFASALGGYWKLTATQIFSEIRDANIYYG
jgi:hypothetical protein